MFSEAIVFNLCNGGLLLAVAIGVNIRGICFAVHY